MNPLALSLVQFYPHANAGPNLFVTTQTKQNTFDQGGARFDHVFSERDQSSLHYCAVGWLELESAVGEGRQRAGLSGGRGLEHAQRSRSPRPTFSAAQSVNVLRAGFFRNVSIPTSR